MERMWEGFSFSLGKCPGDCVSLRFGITTVHLPFHLFSEFVRRVNELHRALQFDRPEEPRTREEDATRAH